MAIGQTVLGKRVLGASRATAPAAPNTKALTATSTVTASLATVKITASLGITITAVTPKLAVEIDFANDPTNPLRVWTDVSTDVRQLTYARSGRSDELQRTQAGTLSALLDNRSGNYDPTNTSGSHYPGVKRMRWIRVRAVWAGVVYERWRGLIETWHQTWPESGRDATVTITATDVFKVLNLFDLNGLSYPSQLTGDRVAAVLASTGVTASPRANPAGTGRTTIDDAGPFSQGSTALAHLLAVEESENGLIYAESDGGIVFQDRYYRLLHSATPIATIGEDTAGGEIPYQEGELDLDDSDIWNEVAVTPNGGTAQIADDLVSQAAHYTRRLNRGSLSSNTAEALSAAQYLVSVYANSSPRLPSVSLLGAAATAKWPTILAAKNSDRFTWKRRAAANTISQDVYVEKVSDTVIPGTSWQVVFELSPASFQTFWVVGDAVNGQAGVTTIAAY